MATDGPEQEPVLISVEKAMEVLELAYANLEFEDPSAALGDGRNADVALAVLPRYLVRPELDGGLGDLAELHVTPAPA